VVLATSVFLLGSLSDDYGDAAFFGWSVLVWAVLAAISIAYERAGQRVAAGLFAFVSVIAFAVVAGAFLDLIGILDADEGPIEGFDIGLLLLYLVTMVAALALLGRFQFPLLVLVASVSGWLFVVDLVSNGGDWTAVVAIVLGLFFLMAGSAADRIYGFWLHVVAGLSIGGGFLELWHSADWEWVLIGIIALCYFLLADALDRSSYAVLGAVGLFLTWQHFVEDWFGDTPVFFFDEGDTGNGVAQALLYALYGFVLFLFGIALERRRRVPIDETPAVP
jgi:hypothetical protein